MKSTLLELAINRFSTPTSTSQRYFGFCCKMAETVSVCAKETETEQEEPCAQYAVAAATT